MNRSVIIALVVFCILSCISSAEARICFRGRPAPECRLFLITEIGAGGLPAAPGGLYFTTEQGLMYNLNEQYAVGFSTYLTLDEKNSHTRAGGKLRFRRWLNRELNVGVAGGLLFWERPPRHGDEQLKGRLPAFVADVNLNYGDWVALYLGLDVLRMPVSDPRDGFNWHVGLKAGSYPGLTISVITAALAILTASVYASGG